MGYQVLRKSKPQYLYWQMATKSLSQQHLCGRERDREKDGGEGSGVVGELDEWKDENVRWMERKKRRGMDTHNILN